MRDLALPPWATPRRIALTVWGAALAASVALVGFPIDRPRIALWALAGVAALNVGRGWRVVVRETLLWLPFIAALLIYDRTRGVADGLGFPVRIQEPLDAEIALFNGVLPSSWLQERLYDPAAPGPLDVAVALVYFSHFVAIWGALLLLYERSRPRWGALMRRTLLLSYLGLLTYIVYPAAPPWLAAKLGLTPEPVARIATRGFEAIGLDRAAGLIEQGQAQVNRVAAIPSLHAAFALLVSVALWPLARRWWQRALLAAYPLAMGFTLVYGGEHYVIDLLLGWAYVGAVLVLVGLGERWWRARRARGAVEGQPTPTSAPTG